MKKFINAIKVLSAESVQEANSGHPGLPLGRSHYGIYIVGQNYEPQST